MEKLLFLLACQLRMMNLFYHNSHNLTKGATFEGDHELFADFYSQTLSNYDDVVERGIGLGFDKVADLSSQLSLVSQKIEGLPEVNSNLERFEVGLSVETELCKIVEVICYSKVSPGVEQLVGEIGNQSEMRQYKIRQRLR